MSFSLPGLIRSARPFESDRVSNSARIDHSFARLVRFTTPFTSLTHSTMDVFLTLIVANMTFIYFRDFVSIPNHFSSHIGQLLGYAVGDDGLVEAFFLSLFLRGLVLGVATIMEENELAWTVCTMALIVVTVTLVLLC